MSLYDFTVTTIQGTEKSLSDYRGKVLLIVNTASKCGFTPQYKGLQALYDAYRDKGFEVLGFPCDQFGHQEPGNEDEILQFCELNFGVTFPLFAKINVNGPQAHPLYQYLTKAKRGILGSAAIKWNFTKFLIDGSGQVIKRFAPTDTPEKIEEEVKRLLSGNA
ncbi:MAG TPA: glutathione peroxidase [Candidatus Bathyarchaeia archaeon]|nr:glutathione peroxidase [Candidatus Bathyarchaeia archaeon]